MNRTTTSPGEFASAATENEAIGAIVRDPKLARAGAWLGGFFRRHPGSVLGPSFDGAGFRELLTDTPIPDWPYGPEDVRGPEALDLFVRAGLLAKDDEGRYHEVPEARDILLALVLYQYRDVEKLGYRIPGLGAAAVERRVLDAGCGVGAYALYYRDLGARSVIALDCDTERLRLTDRFSRASGGGILLVRGTVERLPLADASVDLIHSRVVLPYVHLRRTITEFGRVLSPGGKALLMLHAASFYVWQLREAGLKRKHAPEIILALLGLAGGTAYALLGWEPSWPTRRSRLYLSYQPRRAFSRLLESQGFRIEHWDDNGRKPIVWLSKIAPTPATSA